MSLVLNDKALSVSLLPTKPHIFLTVSNFLLYNPSVATSRATSPYTVEAFAAAGLCAKLKI